MDNRNRDFQSEEEFFQAFKEEVLKLDEEDIRNKFYDYEKVMNYTLHHLAIGSDLVTTEIKSGKIDKYKELDLVTTLSLKLVKALRGSFNALLKYISFSNTVNSPMLLLPHHEKYYIQTEDAKEIEQDVKEFLRNIQPVYDYLNKKVKSSYRSLQDKDIEVEKKEKVINKKSKELSAFKSATEKHSEIADIYIKVLRNSKRKPTVKALEIATNGRISSVTWSRKLKHTSVLDAIMQKLLKLMSNDKRLKDETRKQFYADVYNVLNKTYTDTLTKRLINERKKQSQNLEDNYDEIAYNEYDNEDT